MKFFFFKRAAQVTVLQKNEEKIQILDNSNMNLFYVRIQAQSMKNGKIYLGTKFKFSFKLQGGNSLPIRQSFDSLNFLV